MNLSDFLRKVAAECATHGVALVLAPGLRVFYEGVACNGFFEPRYPVETGLAEVCGRTGAVVAERGRLSPLFAAARGGKTEEEFLSLIAHEYCHMQQFLEDSPLWVDAAEFSLWEDWLAGADVAPDALTRVWHRIVQLEADCEARVLALAEELGLELDLKCYARRANSYLLFYAWALKNRRFYKTAPYEIDAIVAHMPDYLLPLEAYVGGMSLEMMLLFDQCGA